MAFNKIGFHTGPGGNPTGIGDYFRALDNAGIPAVVKSADNYGPCGELAELAARSGVEHVVVFRLSTSGQNAPDVPPDRLKHFDIPDYSLSPVEAAAKHWRTTLDRVPPEFDRDRVWLEPINEVDKNRSNWLGHFAAAIGRRALDEGYKVTLFGWSSGEPEPEHWHTAGMRRYLQMCADHPHRLAVALHEYSLTKDDIGDGFPHKLGRFQQLFAACDAQEIPRPTVHITEWGWEDRRIPGDRRQAMDDIHWAAGLYAAHPQVKGAAIWYLGAGYDGIADRVQRLIAPIKEYTLSARFPDPPAAQPPLEIEEKIKTGEKKEQPIPAPKETDDDRPAPPPAGKVDLLTYLLGDGRLYEVKNSWGSQERMQTQVEGHRFYHTKNQQWEELWADDDFIYRGTDTSPGHGRYLTLRDGDRYGSRWAPRFMAPGERFHRTPTVTFYRKADCRPVEGAGGSQESWLRLVAIHRQHTFQSGITLEDVVEIGASLSPDGEPVERRFYARGFGLVGWEGPLGRSWISEIHEPGARPDNQREEIPCLQRS